MALIIAFPQDRPKCPNCPNNVCAPSGEPKKDGSRYYQKACRGCLIKEKHGYRGATKKQYHKKGRGYGRYKKDHCEKCNFVPVNACQLDVDHIDGNRKNNNIDNLQTLCANCHRLKTHEAKDSYNKKWKVVAA